RQRRRREARDQLGRAYELFDLIGAIAFANRARIELRATGGDPHAPTPDTPQGPTAQEGRLPRPPRARRPHPPTPAQPLLTPPPPTQAEVCGRARQRPPQHARARPPRPKTRRAAAPAAGRARAWRPTPRPRGV